MHFYINYRKNMEKIMKKRYKLQVIVYLKGTYIRRIQKFVDETDKETCSTSDAMIQNIKILKQVFPEFTLEDAEIICNCAAQHILTKMTLLQCQQQIQKYEETIPDFEWKRRRLQPSQKLFFQTFKPIEECPIIEDHQTSEKVQQGHKNQLDLIKVQQNNFISILKQEMTNDKDRAK